MWILPKNHPLSSAFAPAYLDSKEDLNAQSEHVISSLMWKSKPLLWPIWLRKWKQVYWLQPLFGRMLKHSTHGHFVTRYTESLVDIRASHSATQEPEAEQKTPDTFSRIYSDVSRSLSLFSAFSRTSQDTSHWDMEKFTAAYEIWVTRLRQESTQRRKLALHMRENDSLYSQYWATPKASDTTGAHQPPHGTGANLQFQIKKWTTPVATDFNRNTQYQQGEQR
jgi:hypothetical protein